MTTVLWDIDGTLLRTPGFGVRAFDRALLRVAGSTIPRDRPYDFGGKTDPSIARELLTALGLEGRDDLIEPLLREVERAYDDDLDELCTSIRVMPGAQALLAAWADRGVHQTVVTGNLEPVARCKLAAGHLADHLSLDVGAYGSDHEDRAELVRLAMSRSAAEARVVPATTWVIGDTPRDAACAAEAGVRCILVATGTYSIDQLTSLAVDAVLPDLTDTERVLDIVTDGRQAHG